MRSLWILVVFAHVVVSVMAGVLPPEGGPNLPGDLLPVAPAIPLGYTQNELNQECELFCNAAHCFHQVEKDCRYYLDCQRSGNSLHGTLGLCSHGTSWSQDTLTCEKFNPTNCKKLCQGSEQIFEHEDENCKTYWECDTKGNAQPKCCQEGTMFDKASQSCVQADVNNPNCKKPCVISNEGLCSDPGVQIAPLESPNCKIYMDCALSADFPTCCPPNFGFDKELNTCVEDPSCKNECPEGFETNLCPKKRDNYKPADEYCSTYIKCNGSQLVEKRCCADNKMFDSQLGTCEERKQDESANCTDNCPSGSKHDCNLKPADDRTKYMSGTTEMNCPKGLLFNETNCGCSDEVKNAPDNSCNMELNLTMDAALTNTGSEQTIGIEQKGERQEGAGWKGLPSAKLDSFIASIPFFHAQFQTFFIKVVYKVDQIVGKMNLVGNCDPPTFALTIDKSPNGEPMIVLTLKTINTTTSDVKDTQLELKFKTTVVNEFEAYYDGNELVMSNNGGGPESQDYAELPLSGEVAMAEGGLHIGACEKRGTMVEPFKGEVVTVQFTKCVKDEWMKDVKRTTVDLP